jgi:hypothetical protein
MTIAQKLSSLVSSTIGLTQPQQSTALINLGAQYTHNNLFNGKLVESHASNAATYSIKTLAGNDPSVIDPVSCRFPDASTLTIISALSLVFPNQATFGAGAAQARIWFALANDSGTPRLVARRCTTAGVIAGFDARGILSASTPVASTSCVNYSNATITTRPYQIIAFADYEGGLTSGGSWTTSPTRIMMVGPNTPLPGTIVQELERIYTGQTNNPSGTPVASNVYQYITPTSNMNGVRVHFECDTFLSCAASQEDAIIQMYRNGAQLGPQYHTYGWGQTVVMPVMFSSTFLDFPFSTAQQLYQVYFWLTVNGGNAWYVPWHAGITNLQELVV